jgi:hypothetical protein
MVKRTPYESIPAYLGAVTILEPQGNIVADVLAEVAKIGKRRKRPRMLAIAVGAVITVVAAALAARMFTDDAGPGPQPCYLTAQLRWIEGSDAVPQGTTLDVSHEGATRSFIVSDDGTASIDVGPLTAPRTGWTLQVNGPDGALLGREEIQGCASSPQEHRLDGGLELIVRPR